MHTRQICHTLSPLIPLSNLLIIRLVVRCKLDVMSVMVTWCLTDKAPGSLSGLSESVQSDNQLGKGWFLKTLAQTRIHLLTHTRITTRTQGHVHFYLHKQACSHTSTTHLYQGTIMEKWFQFTSSCFTVTGVSLSCLFLSSPSLLLTQPDMVGMVITTTPSPGRALSFSYSSDKGFVTLACSSLGSRLLPWWQSAWRIGLCVCTGPQWGMSPSVATAPPARR